MSEPTGTETAALQNKQRDLFILVVALVLIFIMAARTPLDTDMWWHIRTGEEIVNLGKPVLTDSLSFTRYGTSYFNLGWIPEVIMYELFQNGGFFALALWVALLVTLSLYLVSLQMQVPVMLKAFLMIFAGLVTAPLWTSRPHLVSLVLLSLVGYILYLYKWQRLNRLGWLVPIFIIWGNMHAGYALGFLLIGAMVAGEILNHLLGFKGEDILPWKAVARLIFWAVLGAIGLLINPVGINIWLVPFNTVGITVLQKFIEEWASPDFHILAQQPFIWLLLACLGAVGLSLRRIDGYDLAALVVFAYLALTARRNIGPFAMVAVPVLSRYLWPAIQGWAQRAAPTLRQFLTDRHLTWEWLMKPPRNNPKRSRLINLSIVTLLTFMAIGKLYYASYPLVVSENLSKTFPDKAMAWIQSNHPRGQMLNAYGWGGYFVWYLRDYPVFVDGRTDLFDDELITQWINVVQAEPGWEAVLDKWDINLVVLEPNWTIVKVLPLEGWKTLYEDDVAVVLGR